MCSLIRSGSRNMHTRLHKGEDTEYYLSKGFKIVAFEANPDLVEYYRDKFARFIEEGTLVIVEGAIVDCDSLGTGEGKIRFYGNKHQSVWGTVCVDWARRTEGLREREITGGCTYGTDRSNFD